jgi:hypothetical protein
MKEKLTPANAPGFTLAFVGPRQSSPTFCQSASVGEPLPAPGTFRIWETTLSSANDGVDDRIDELAASAAPRCPF